jgi:predicted nucleic acid-binding protein
MKLFIDANVLISVLNKEQPLFSMSSRILSLAGDSRYTLFTSPLCLAIAYYFSEKKSGKVVANKKIRLLCQNIRIAEISELAVNQVVENTGISDFEDGLQYYAAENKKVNYIVTENVADFYFANMPVLDCKSFFEQVMTQTK